MLVVLVEVWMRDCRKADGAKAFEPPMAQQCSAC